MDWMASVRRPAKGGGCEDVEALVLLLLLVVVLLLVRERMASGEKWREMRVPSLRLGLVGC
jgi:hypothetical protein